MDYLINKEQAQKVLNTLVALTLGNPLPVSQAQEALAIVQTLKKVEDKDATKSITKSSN